MTRLVILLLMLIPVAVASEQAGRPKGVHRRAFVPRTDQRFSTSSGLGGWDHEAVQEVAARAPKPKPNDSGKLLPF